MWRSSILRILLEGLLRTVRFEIRNEAVLESLGHDGKPFVMVFWHGSMLYPWWRMRNSNAAALVSHSKDGQILSGMLGAWGYKIIHGSSSRGSTEAMQLMRDVVNQGRSLCITPDGPRGPIHELKMGAVRVAQTMHVPLVLMAVGIRSGHVLHSWDHFTIPYPFSRALVEVSDPIVIDPSLTGVTLEDRRADLEKQFVAMHRIVNASS